jgi:3'(2'), 5'-bisphosphate nucleotidase
MHNKSDANIDGMQLEQWMQDTRVIAAEASLKIMDIYIREEVQVTTKSDDSPLTQADMAAHNHILQRLNQLTPEIPVLSEENVSEFDDDLRTSWPIYWLVDPLDGTKEFIAQNGEFTVNIALIENNKPVIGVVAVPAKKISYFAAKGCGAFKAGPDEQAKIIKTRKFSGGEDQQPVIVTSRRTGVDRVKPFLNQIDDYTTTAMGSSIKMCLVAEGKADLYPRLGLTSEWDTAASQCVVEEAGGAILDLETREPLAYGAKKNILNPEFLTLGDLSFDHRKILPC